MKNIISNVPVSYRLLFFFRNSKILLIFGFALMTLLGTFHLVRDHLPESTFSVLVIAFFTQSLLCFAIYLVINLTVLHRRLTDWKPVKNFLIFLFLTIGTIIILGILGLLTVWFPDLLTSRQLFFLISAFGILAMFFGVGFATQIHLIWEKKEKQAQITATNENQKKSS